MDSYYYALHVMTTISPDPMLPSTTEQHRVEIEWPTPIEYASDLQQIEAHVSDHFYSGWLSQDPSRLEKRRASVTVQILNWQPLKGHDRPEGEGGEELA